MCKYPCMVAMTSLQEGPLRRAERAALFPSKSGTRAIFLFLGLLLTAPWTTMNGLCVFLLASGLHCSGQGREASLCLRQSRPATPERLQPRWTVSVNRR